MSVCMLLSLCACGKSDNKKSNSKNSSDESNITDTYEDNPSFETPEEDNTENITTTKPEVKLSESCSMVLCSGTDGSDYYELVANQIDGYPDSTFEFGVIKNNQWLVPMGSDCPFIDDKGWWVYEEYTNKPGEFTYMGHGCFYYESYNTKIIYNPETNISFDNFALISNPIDPEYLPSPDYVMNDKYEIILLRYYTKDDYSIAYVNLNTGESKKIPFEKAYEVDDIGYLNDNLFYADIGSLYHPCYGFFDLNGNMVIDLTEYPISDFGDYCFTDGKYTFTVANTSGVYFDITIDTTGKVLSQEKVES